MSVSDIVRVSTGLINTVNDALPGGGGGNIGPQTGLAPGQLGKWLDLDANDLIYNSALGNVYPGRFLYVQLAVDSLVPIAGQLLYRDNRVAWTTFYRLTTDEALSSADASIFIAGVNLNPALTPGNYTFIQIMGDADLMCVASLSNAGAIGGRLYASANGGADLGFVDQLGGAGDITALSTVTLYQGRYVGKAVGLPTSGQLVKTELVDFGQGA